ncbi:MAG: hypothetical protein M1815_004898 [Lichina confinis]|nr:MAG: hypothetical protein M1815_004898 [Lichina confinis]
MSDGEIVDDLIGFMINNDEVNSSRSDDDEQVGLESEDRMTEMMGVLRSMQMTIDSMDKKIARLELKVGKLEIDIPIDRPRNHVALPDPDALRHTKSPAFGNSDMRRRQGLGEDTDSFSNISRTKSESSAPATPADMNCNMNRPFNNALFSVSTRSMFKSNSATANRGYDNKMTLWGTAFTSLVVACMRKYMSFTQETAHIIDEVFLMKTYSKIVSDLYHRIKYTDLPAVQSPEALFVSKMFFRKDSKDVPQSNATDWWKMQNSGSDGASAMAVIETIFKAAKMVPEATMHPISQLITEMDQPVVRMGPKGPTFSIPAKTKVNMSPNGSESFCRCLKKDTLKKYVNYRLQGDDETVTIVKMTQTMKETDLFDSKNMHRGRELRHQT